LKNTDPFKRKASPATNGSTSNSQAVAEIAAIELNGRIFAVGTQNGCNKNLGIWGHQAGLMHNMEELSLKELTWHSARLTFSILLQDQGVDAATVALLLGHTTTKYVLEVYKRHRPNNQMATIVKLPKAHWKTMSSHVLSN
jgi:hypothetical protein